MVKNKLKNINWRLCATTFLILITIKFIPGIFIKIDELYYLLPLLSGLAACFLLYCNGVILGKHDFILKDFIKVFSFTIIVLIVLSHLIDWTIHSETIKDIAEGLAVLITYLSHQLMLVGFDASFVGNTPVPPSPTTHSMDGQPGSSSNIGNPGGGSNIAGSSSNPGGSSSIAGSSFNLGDFGNSGNAGKFGKHVKTVITPIGTFFMDEHGKLLDEYGRIIHRKGLEDYVSHEVAHYRKDIEEIYSLNDLFRCKLNYIKERAEKQSSIIRKIMNRRLTDETRVEIARIQDSYRDSIREAVDCANSSRFDDTDYHRKASSLEALEWVQRQKEVQVLLRNPLISERDRVRITRMIRQIPCLKSDNYIARMYALSFESEIQKQRLNDKWEKLDKLYLFSELKHKGSPDDYIERKRR